MNSTPEGSPGNADGAGPPSVLIIEDHKVWTDLLVAAFRDVGFDDVTVAPPDELRIDALIELVMRIRPDVVLLDLHLGCAGPGTGQVRPLAAAGATVLVMTASNDPEVLGECLEAGAVGILSKVHGFERLAETVRSAASGHAVISPAARDRLLAELAQQRRTQLGARQPFEGLTCRERVVLAGLVRGTTAGQIAAEEHVTLATVRSQIRGVLRKLEVNSQLQAVAMAHGADWTDTD